MASKNSTREKPPLTRQNSNTQLQISKEDLGCLLDQKLQQNNKDLLLSFQQEIQPLKSEVGVIKNSVQYTLEEVKKISQLENEVIELRDTITVLTSENSDLKEQLGSLKHDLLKQETFSRRDNLKLFGVNENKGENVPEKVVNVFSKVGLDVQAADLHEAHRIGKFNPKRARPILIHVPNKSLKDRIFRCKPDLKTNQNVIVTKDLPLQVVENRKTLVPIYLEAVDKHSDLNPKLVGDRLTLGGEVFTIDTIHQIPVADLRPSNFYTRSSSGITAFYSKNSLFSNFYQCSFKVDGKIFHSTEQFYTFHKASFFNDILTANAILLEKDPLKNKKQGSFIKNFNVSRWQNVQDDFMQQGVFAKFSQNEDLKQTLLNTEDQLLAEANPYDHYWGTGLSLTHEDAFAPDKWKGRNNMGKVLGHVRQQLLS